METAIVRLMLDCRMCARACESVRVAINVDMFEYLHTKKKTNRKDLSNIYAPACAKVLGTQIYFRQNWLRLIRRRSLALSLPHKFLQILRTPRSEPSPSDCSTVDDDADVSHLSHLAAIGADRRTVWEGMAAAAAA